jgi:hypothetical protein
MDFETYNVVDVDFKIDVMDFCGHSKNRNQFNGKWSNMNVIVTSQSDPLTLKE